MELRMAYRYLVTASIASLIYADDKVPLEPDDCYVPTQTPYLDEESPFGWPLTPNDWSYTDLSQWSDKYMTCNGENQSPIDISLSSPTCPVQQFGTAGGLLKASSYLVGQRANVGISKYLRTAYVEGDFGSIVLKDGAGNDVTYDAVQVHLTSPSLHTVDGEQYDAEMLVLHKPRGESTMLASAVAVSMLFKAGGTSSVFSDIGFSDDDTPFNSGSQWYAPSSLDLPRAMASPLAGEFYFYNGSIPVPPCTENVKYFVMKNTRTVSSKQTKKLQDALNCFAGGVKKRGPRQNPYLNKCRKIYANDLRIGSSHSDPTCEAATKNGTWQRSAECWNFGSSIDQQKECARSTIDVDSSKARPMDPAFPMGTSKLSLQAASLVKVTPKESYLGLTAIDINRPYALGHFGQLSINGRIFFARSINIRPISSHTYQGGKYYAGELQIHHLLFGDEFDFNSSSSVDQDTWSNSSLMNGMHRVIVSIPLKLGKESVFLRQVGLSGGRQGSIRDGLSYQVSDVDVVGGLQSYLDGTWVWYSGGPEGPGCPEWGVRWMMFEEPMEVSIMQLNSLILKVSGVDSVSIQQPKIPDASYGQRVFKQSVPVSAVDSDEACESKEWGYDDISCWSQKYPACAGRKQSPIDLRDEDVKERGYENFLSAVSWKPVSHLRVFNTGHNMQITNGQLGYITLIGDDGFPWYFTTAQVHLHMPSEHLINGRQYAAELQIIHNRQKRVTQSANSLDSFPLVATSFMFDIADIDEDSPLLKQFRLSDGPLGTLQSVEAIDPVDFMRSFGPALEGKFYRYDGSVTIPDCHEQVKWFVFDHVFNMSRIQWQNFNSMYANPANNRPVQPLNGRKVSINTFQEGRLVHYDYYGARNRGRNIPELGKGWIAAPIGGAVLLWVAVMLALFVREGKLKLQSAGGLAETIGRGQYNQL